MLGALLGPTRAAAVDLDDDVAIPLPEERPALLAGTFEVGTLSTLSPGSFCPGAGACVLGGGVALGASVGRRWASGLGVALGYDLWLLDSGGVYEVLVVQSVSAAVRYVALPRVRVHPFVEGRVGALALGGSFRVGALGASMEPRLGLEFELTERIAVSGALGVRWMVATPFTTPNDGVLRGGSGPPGVSLAVSLGLVVLQAS